MPRTFVATLVITLFLGSGCHRSPDQEKAQRILARDDRRLTDIVCAWLSRDGVAQSPAEHAIADVTKAFEMVGDEGLSAFVETPPRTPSATRAREALSELGLSDHASVLADLVALAAKGPVAADAMIALDERFRALPDPAPVIARYIRAHAAEIRLSRANEKVVP